MTPVSTAEFSYKLAGRILKPSLENLATVGVTLTCGPCGLVIDTGFGIYEANQSITFDGVLRIHDVYFNQPTLFKTPFDNIGE